MASDWILRELLPPELDAEDLELELQLQETNIADACPPGPKGLHCRRRFALRGADECAGGESGHTPRGCWPPDPSPWRPDGTSAGCPLGVCSISFMLGSQLAGK